LFVAKEKLKIYENQVIENKNAMRKINVLSDKEKMEEKM